MHHVEGPTVCPFVALESDRDRRLAQPDHRHRCYAEPTPAPRAIAHQEAYCLSPGFTLCPIFQDWAKRAAASPISSGSPAAAAGEPGPTGEPEQLAVFDAPLAPSVEPAPPYSRAGASAAAPPPQAPPRQIERIPSSPERPPVEPAPLPAFLASRERRSATSEPPASYPSSDADDAPQRFRPRPTDERSARREAVVPSWDREERFNPPTAGRARIGRGEGLDIVGRMTTILAVLALLSLALLLLVFAPGFLGGSPNSSAPVGGASATPGQTAAPATSTPAPVASPQTYTIRAGDNLFRIASQFGLTIEQLQAANPQITNPNLIQAGQVIVIPPADFGLPTPGPAATPRTTP